MKEKLIELLNDIDEDIVAFDGDNLFDEGVIDSFTVVEIVTEIESKFGIEVKSDDVIEKNFRTVNDMLSLIERLTSN